MGGRRAGVRAPGTRGWVAGGGIRPGEAECVRGAGRPAGGAAQGGPGHGDGAERSRSRAGADAERGGRERAGPGPGGAEGPDGSGGASGGWSGPHGSHAPAAVRRSRALHLTWRVVILLAGAAVVAGGVLLLALPGPGWLVIFAGLALLASEFPWAQRLLHWAGEKGRAAARRATDPGHRRRNALLLAAVVAVVAAGAVLYARQWGRAVPW